MVARPTSCQNRARTGNPSRKHMYTDTDTVNTKTCSASFQHLDFRWDVIISPSPEGSKKTRLPLARPVEQAFFDTGHSFKTGRGSFSISAANQSEMVPGNAGIMPCPKPVLPSPARRGADIAIYG